MSQSNHRFGFFLSGAVLAVAAVSLVPRYGPELSEWAQMPDLAPASATAAPAAEPEVMMAPFVAPPRDTREPLVQLAILLDTSSSMDGLIDQARAQLWNVVNELGEAERGGKTPRLEIAIYEYGNSGLDATGGYIRRVVPFTDDLDGVSEALFSLTTGGGSEHCGQVIDRAHDELQWSDRDDVFRVMYVAGNEAFTQGPVDFREAIADAKEAGIIVNTVHCGSQEAGSRGKWELAAALADGRYLPIDHNRKVAHIAAPQDAEIARLSAELNDTYVHYGSAGRRGYDNQMAQDNNAASVGTGSVVSRSMSKAGGNYRNDTWDLVDAVDTGRARLSKVDRSTLPEEMRGLDDDALKKAVAVKKAEREKIQKKIKKLTDARRKHVAAEKKKAAAAGATTLDDAIVASIRAQAGGAGFRFPSED